MRGTNSPVVTESPAYVSNGNYVNNTGNHNGNHFSSRQQWGQYSSPQMRWQPQTWAVSSPPPPPPPIKPSHQADTVRAKDVTMLKNFFFFFLVVVNLRRTLYE